MTEREKLLMKLQNGTFIKEDLEKLMDFICENPQEEDDEVMHQLWRELENYERLEKGQSKAIMDRTLSLIDKQDTKKPLQAISKNENFTKLRSRRLILRYAAAAILLLTTGTYSWFKMDQQELTTISTQYGEQKEFTLPDQSTVKLNSNSSISFNKHWGDGEIRQVWLKGEAYFEVQKKPVVNQKFEVLTKDLKVEVLGTIFNVNAREQMTTVFLEEGKVHLDLEDRADNIDMKPGEVISYSRETRLPERKEIVEEVPASWRNGTMEFRDSPLKDILQRLKEIYGITVIYENEMHLERRFRISIPIESLDLAFDVLKEVTELDLIIEDNKIIVK